MPAANVRAERAAFMIGMFLSLRRAAWLTTQVPRAPVRFHLAQQPDARPKVERPQQAPAKARHPWKAPQQAQEAHSSMAWLPQAAVTSCLGKPPQDLPGYRSWSG